ncbi:MAG TPA: CotH kinase family protein [Candidatus Acutalibacter ornithocaccae]|uniref:CotH kinase family protein n=1 Tax=Candidatus Acutalibacter ornithocaccae TaxID=2838416 RepID=A0A9D2LYA5_9FIRM|nr:CotH kinase family protein [Candidatus Acutalibacter ornithocaccae]
MGSQGLQAAAREMGYESRLFDTASVHTIDIVTEDWEGFLETAQREEYSLCSLVIDGETYENVAIRGKGNTSLTQVEQYGNSRYSFKVEFDHYDNALNYYGLDKLSLNNLIQDNTMLKDYLCYQLMGSFGVDAPLCSFVYITVNGEDWGLYLAVEGVEESFLQRNYGSSYGELYKPDSQSMGGGRGNGGAFSLGDWQQEAAGETGGAAAGSQDTSPAAPDGQEGMGSPPELPSGEGPQEAPGQAVPDSASSATEESPSSEVESSSGEGDTSSGEESPSAPEEQASPGEAGGAMGQEPPTQPAEGAADAGIEAQPGALGQGQRQASSATEQWVLLGGSFLGMGLAVAGLYRRKG